jgi:hypothetical protein
MTNDVRHGRIIRMQHPENHDQIIQGAVHPSTFTKMLEDERWSALGDYVGLIFDFAILEIPGSIFQGLKRPRFNIEVDKAVYAYHTKCNRSYTFGGVDPRRDGPRQTDEPLHSVFTTFVSLEEGVVKEIQASLRPTDGLIGGGVLYWEWTPASPFADHLPVDYDGRYRRRVWLRP